MQMRARWIPRLTALVLCLFAISALARIGGGENFDSGSSDSGGSGGDASFIVDILIWLIIRHPAVGIPVTIVVIIIAIIVRRSKDGDSSTRKAIDKAEAERRTNVSASAVDGWVTAPLPAPWRAR